VRANKKNIIVYSGLLILLLIISAIGISSFVSYRILVKNIYVLQSEIKQQEQETKGQGQVLNDLKSLPDVQSQLANFYPGKIVKDVQPTSGAATLGNPKAKVTLVEFADFQCPFCKKFFTETEPDIVTKYVNTGKVKLVFENFPFLGAESQAAAEAANCAGEQNNFWPYHDYLYSQQGAENSGVFSDKNLEKFFSTFKGLNAKNFKACLEQHKEEQSVSNEYQLGIKLNVSSTPTIFINGREVVGSYSTQTYENIIDEELKK